MNAKNQQRNLSPKKSNESGKILCCREWHFPSYIFFPSTAYAASTNTLFIENVTRISFGYMSGCWRPTEKESDESETLVNRIMDLKSFRICMRMKMNVSEQLIAASGIVFVVANDSLIHWRKIIIFNSSAPIRTTAIFVSRISSSTMHKFDTFARHKLDFIAGESNENDIKIQTEETLVILCADKCQKKSIFAIGRRSNLSFANYMRKDPLPVSSVSSALFFSLADVGVENSARTLSTASSDKITIMDDV